MRKIILSNILILLSFFLYGQEFQMKLWFQDAIGKRDSIIVGYDPLATNGIDASFGEADIFSIPWSGSLEARAGDAGISSNNLYLTKPATIHTKKQIIGKTCNFYNLIKIAVNCINFPLVIKWDTSVSFDDPCRYSSFITSGTAWGGDWFDGQMAFMNSRIKWSHKDSLVITQIGGTHSAPVYYTQNGLTIIQLNVSFGNKEPLMSINENKLENFFEVFPNPVKNRFRVMVSAKKFDLYDCKIFDVVGELVFHKEIFGYSNGQTIEINDICLTDGLYIVILTDKSGSTLSKKIIVKN